MPPMCYQNAENGKLFGSSFLSVQVEMNDIIYTRWHIQADEQ